MDQMANGTGPDRSPGPAAPFLLAGALVRALREPAADIAPKSKAIRVRLDPLLLDRLNAVVELAEKRGHHHITRSSLIRDALASYLEPLEAEFPELRAAHGEHVDHRRA